MGVKKYSIEDARAVARERGGTCLSDWYQSTSADLDWKCRAGHVWRATFKNVKDKGSWCAVCAGAKKLTIEEARAYARSKGGWCLSTAYINSDSPLRWKCRSGHIWNTPFGSIKHGGSWCPTCAGKTPLTLADAKEHAESRGGACLSSEYKDTATIMHWGCKKGHTWMATFSNLRHGGHWCPHCAGMAPHGIEFAKKLAEERGGTLVTTVYTNVSTPMLWKCKKGHTWATKLSHVLHSGSWCPYCLFKSEQACRSIIEAMTGKAFPKRRPSWLNGLELDGYCEELGVAFEYNGRQHYEEVKAWHRSEDALENQKTRDARKIRLCEDNWVILIVIPYTVTAREEFIRNELRGII